MVCVLISFEKLGGDCKVGGSNCICGGVFFSLASCIGIYRGQVLSD